VTVLRIYDRLVASAIDLPELPAATGHADLHVRVGRLPALDGQWQDLWPPATDTSPCVRVRRTASGYRIRYEAQADFEFVQATRALLVDAPDCPPETLRHFLLDQVIPLVLSLDGLVLHASACRLHGVVAAFAGPAGVGKSTIAALLAADGHAVCADDALVVRAGDGVARAVPAYPGLRLWPDMLSAAAPVEAAGTPGTAKRRIVAGWQFGASASPLGCVYVLDAASAASITIAPLSARDAAMAMLEHSYRLEQRDPDALARQMDLAFEAARVVPGSRLSYPRCRSAWPEVALAVVGHLQERAVRPC
jgi:hypothetical protein